MRVLIAAMLLLVLMGCTTNAGEDVHIAAGPTNTPLKPTSTFLPTLTPTPTLQVYPIDKYLKQSDEGTHWKIQISGIDGVHYADGPIKQDYRQLEWLTPEGMLQRVIIINGVPILMTEQPSD